MTERNFAIIADWFSGCFFIVGSIGITIAGVAAGFGEGVAAGLRIYVLSILFAAASAICGWLLGLLFGIPRSLASADMPAQSSSSADTPAAGGHIIGYFRRTSRVNTNLEDISDWLTKTIVGVGLTQLYWVPHYLWNAAQKLNIYGFHWGNYGALLALSLFLYFAPSGFWLGYIGTRTFLTMWLDVVDRGTAAAASTSADPDKLVLANAGIGIAGAPDPAVAAADRMILSKKLQELTTAREVAAWAAAQARRGNLETAQIAIEDALQGEPDDADIKKLAAVIYSATGQHAESNRLLSDQPESDISVFNALYQPPPEGFNNASQIGETLLKQPAQQKNANLRVWMACAYGQQYGYEANRNASADQLQQIKGKVLGEINAALQVNPNTREWLRSLWCTTPGVGDDDLTVFARDDPDLSSLLGGPCS